jgi:hypothetical protein
MGMHWTDFQSTLNTAAKSLGKEPRFLVIPDQREHVPDLVESGSSRGVAS